jgi:hypothetical protein
MARQISDLDSVIDSRDVIERISELLDRITIPDHDCTPVGACAQCDEFNRGVDPEDELELESLRNLERVAQYADDWIYGATLVRDSYWEDYAREYFDDVYGHEIDKTSSVAASYLTIDYDQFASDLQVDYTDVDFDGVTYWVR